ncbi:GNAT family N-acetyltransferase [Flaviflexus ciconiae]|uniref:GNAT family N-acetyltransferase n=1 Tax=Flaviflexus ciconiae TaxID=2496867 RepID=A0A3S9PUW8_9ACTO|nr:GNAT family N-acetyltransferase [Flaviflexus ciconiae]AZQ76143.1 GNAT family N-acetyltransferase [Flaviflexus ciconiae]
MSVELMTVSTPEVVEAINELLPQLSKSASLLTEEQVDDLLAQEMVYLFAFRHDETNAIVGMLTLATFKIPTGLRAWVEDVVVSGAARGQGAGRKLIEEAVAYADKLGAKSVDLTSRPTREAANRLYMRCGFEKRETNVYRFNASAVVDSL